MPSVPGSEILSEQTAAKPPNLVTILDDHAAGTAPEASANEQPAQPALVANLEHDAGAAPQVAFDQQASVHADATVPGAQRTSDGARSKGGTPARQALNCEHEAQASASKSKAEQHPFDMLGNPAQAPLLQPEAQHASLPRLPESAGAQEQCPDAASRHEDLLLVHAPDLSQACENQSSRDYCQRASGADPIAEAAQQQGEKPLAAAQSAVAKSGELHTSAVAVESGTKQSPHAEPEANLAKLSASLAQLALVGAGSRVYGRGRTSTEQHASGSEPKGDTADLHSK